MKKKLLTLLPVLVFSAAFFAACTPETPGNTDTMDSKVVKQENTIDASTASDQLSTGKILTSEEIQDIFNSLPEEPVDASPEDEVPVFEKQYGPSITVEDEFSDNLVLVGIMPSEYPKEYTVEDFADVGCIEIKGTAVLKTIHEESNKKFPFRYYILVLEEHSKENVIDAIQILSERPDILFAHENAYMDIYLEPSDPYYTAGNQ